MALPYSVWGIWIWVIWYCFEIRILMFIQSRFTSSLWGALSTSLPLQEVNHYRVRVIFEGYIQKTRNNSMFLGGPMIFSKTASVSSPVVSLSLFVIPRRFRRGIQHNLIFLRISGFRVSPGMTSLLNCKNVSWATCKRWKTMKNFFWLTCINQL